MRTLRTLAAITLPCCLAFSASATIYTVDFEDGVIGSSFNYTAPYNNISGVSGTLSGDISNKYLILNVNHYYGSDYSEFATGPGGDFILPGNVRAQHLSVLHSFDIFVPIGGALYITGHRADISLGSWQHIDLGYLNHAGEVVYPTDLFGSFVTILGFGGAVDNIVFNDIVTSIFVPEPASWAMMVLGFCMLGAAVRVRRPRLGFNA